MVPVPNMKDMKVVEYENRIPYSENVWNGKDSRVVQRWRTSTMSKVIPKDHELVKVTRPIKNAIDPANLKFYSVDGKPIESKKALEKMVERVPVLLLGSDGPPPEFFSSVLKPETILVFQKPGA